jgi:acyl transferase domain-containing protein/NAD(P)H-dependent flavin oxidoreductase YrpB (nitropropane dioxygenase family)/acyl carrier protein
MPTRILALAPPGNAGLGLVAAACRASALGILDLGGDGLRDSGPFEQLERWTHGPYGMRIRAVDLLKNREIGNRADGLKVLWIIPATADEDGGSLEAAIRASVESGRMALAEVASRAEIRRALAAGASGLIVAGHEAGGRCGSDSSFVLLQAALAEGDRPVWVRGGVGERVAAGAVAAGAAGVVLDGALLLARESPLVEGWRERIARWDGSETTAVMPATAPGVRVFAMPGSAAMAQLREAAEAGGSAWEAAVAEAVGWGDGQCPPVGQDSAMAARMARKFVTVGGIVQAVERSIAEGIAAARAARPLAEGSPMAVELGTRYPILQGPMTRVSDVAPFAEAVARDGGLPFVALAMLRGPEVRRLLDETAARLAGRPWGVGVLGFISPELRAEQLAAVAEVRPPWALIAGGRPDQAAGLERQGIRTFLHVPSPGLLEQYLRDGCRRFVLEGRECGGHVGPRSSFVLWEQAAAVVADAIDRGIPAAEIGLVFAGGVHDARSAAMVAGLAGPLAARGVKVGVLAGTAYLFTREAVETGAIVGRFQQEAIRCDDTVLLESGPGHQVRVSPSPFVARFVEERRRLIAEGRPADEVREALEGLNVGRLRVAAKGVERINGEGSLIVPVDDSHQQANGLYMLGQAATLRNATTTIAQLHREIAVEGTAHLDREIAGPDATDDEQQSSPSDIAIIGMSSVFPGAADLPRFWSNTLRGVDAITEIPPDRWDWRLYYDPDPKAPDKIVSKWGGFLPDVAFDPLKYGMPPSSLPSIEPAQLLALEVVRNALGDAGYAERAFARERTAVVLGMGGGAAQLAMGYAFRSYLPMLDTVIPGGGRAAIEACRGQLPEWTEDSFPGFLLNVTAGRIANRLNLGGANYTVDAACGSSLAAAALAVRELETGAADMVVLGGVDTVQNPFTYLAFSKTQAFSPRGRCRPFDAGANGIVISEGVAAVVLKRLADAERDGDRIYAVIKGVGASSDGRARGLTAPVVEGQIRAMERAYRKAGVSPATVGYVEAHGTGTALGDVVEFESLSRVFRSAGVGPHDCVVGSVKSLIGHTKCAAGLAGLINASLSLHHKVLPPTIGIETPNPKLDLRDGPFRLCTQAEPWLHPDDGLPRRAGVSAFGFGGTNFHAVLEEYRGNTTPAPASALPDWPSELMVFEADRPDVVVAAIDRLTRALEAGARPALRDLSHTLISALGEKRGRNGRPILAIVADSHDDLLEKLRLARIAIAAGRDQLDDPRGIHYAAAPAWADAKVAFLFPGQGAQSPGMLRELAVAFPEVRGAFEEFDRAVMAGGGTAPGPLVFAPPAFDDAAREVARRSLARTDVAQPAIGAACVGMLRLLGALGLEPDMVGGHSYGELVALHAAGVLGARDLAQLSAARGRLMIEAGHGDAGAMAAILAGPDAVEGLLRAVPGLQVANWNGPRQTVVAGPAEAVERLLAVAAARDIVARRLPVSSAFHTPMVAGAREPFARLAAAHAQRPPDRPVYSNIDATPYPADGPAIAARLGEHLASPVHFADMVEAMYRDGATVFIEAGPGSILTPMVDSILEGRPHLSVACDPTPTPGLSGFLRRLARLVAAGLPLRLERLTAGRAGRRLDLDHLPPGDLDEPPTPSTWLVNGSRARPFAAPEPTRLETKPALPIPVPEPHATTPIQLNGNGKLEPAMTSTPPTAPAPLAVPVPPLATTAAQPQADPVLESFQQTMRAFLEVQKATMLAYLNGRNSGGRVAAAAPSVPVSVPAPTLAAGASPTVAAGPSNHRSLHQNGDANGHTNGNGHASPSAWHAASRSSAPKAPPRPAPAVAVEPPISPPPLAPTGPAAETAATAPPDRARITDRLLEIVRDRTGYPIETLALDLDIEADLGIDSIKRVEILGKLRDEFPAVRPPSDSTDAMDALARARTLGAIVDRMVAMAGPSNDRSPADKDSSSILQSSILQSSIFNPSILPSIPQHPARPPRVERRVLEPVDAPTPRDRGGLMPGGRVVVTDDGRGVAAELASRLGAEGIAADCLGGPERPVDWTSPSAIHEAIVEIRSQGPIAGIVHAMPMGQPASDEPGDDRWADRMGDAVKGLFLLARSTAADLESAAEAGGSGLIAATGLGGRFAACGEPSHSRFFPGHGGIAGLVKTLAREWPTIRCRAVDLSPDDPPAALADILADELFAIDGWAEVGHDRGRRIRLRSVERPLVRSVPAIELAPGEPVIITGGARGITGLVAAELARAWHPTLLIVGTTPEPTAPEPADTAALDGVAELKAALHARLRREGHPAGPADIEAAYQALRRAREVRDNLEVLRRAGATVEYARADVRDPSALAAALGGWRERHGDPVGLIHGAGLIKDKLIREKTPEAFDRVLGTKVQGALNLIGLVRPDSLKFTALFSSIAGRFGNVGQADYAAANEVLNKLGQWLDRRWPGRVLSVIWGPWSGVGMVSQLEGHLGRRGLGMIAPEVGRTLLLDELRFGQKGDVEVIYTGGLGTLEDPLPIGSAAPLAEAVR